MKRTILFLFFCFFSTLSYSAVDDTPFLPHLCQNGRSGTWINACSCSKGYSGAYCDEEGVPCPEETGDMYPNSGLCYKAITYAPIDYQNKTFYISRSLMNFNDALAFCKVLNSRLATRADLNCFSEGVGCVDLEILVLFQEKTYSRGFVWLDKHVHLNEAYYMDINDGVVYHTNADSSAVTQALCIQEK